MWIGTNSGLFRLPPDGHAEQFTSENGLSGNGVASLLEDKNGRIWAGMRSTSVADGLCLLVAEPQKNQKIVERIFTLKDGLPAIWIPALYQSSDGKLLVAGLADFGGNVDFFVLRHNANGTLNNSFGAGELFTRILITCLMRSAEWRCSPTAK